MVEKPIDEEFYKNYTIEEIRDFLELFIDCLETGCEIVEKEYEKQLEEEDGLVGDKKHKT